VFSNLSPGNHTLSVTAWDTYNNFSTQTIDFVVSDKNNIIINSIYNVPNPFQTKTTFWIDHNKPRELLEANVVIHDISGKKVWDHTQTLYSGDSGSSEITWDGKSYNGVVLNKGVYLCTISLKSTLSNTNFTESHRIILH
jgi:flagellar hook assembly protein FlgD